MGKQGGPMITVGPDGRLVYGQTHHQEQFLDFSNCGYRGGGHALPEAPVIVAVSPSPGNSSTECMTDDTARIQAAIDSIQGLQESGINPDDIRDEDPFQLSAILLKAGTYYVKGSLFIRKSGIVLRGEGQYTTIIATGKDQRTLIHVQGGKGPGKACNKNGSFPITFTDEMDKLKLGETRIPCQHQGYIKVGDRVSVRRNTNEKWIRRLGMDELHDKDPQAHNWRPEKYVQNYERTVTQVPDDDSIVVHCGLPCTIQRNFGGGDVLRLKNEQRISHVGVESMVLISEYVKGEENRDEDHAWSAVWLDGVKDGWVRNITARHFGYSCVGVGHPSTRITVQDCRCEAPVSMIRGGRRYSFNICGSFCLFQRCYSRHGRHNFVNGSQVKGPNVFLDCTSEDDHADSGPHHRWSVSTLFDRVKTKALNAQNRGTSGTGHGWAGANMIFWNCVSKVMKCQHPPAAENFSIGCIVTDGISGDGHIESTNTHVAPSSLYLAQLRDRLGMDAVRRIATLEQYAFLEQ